MAAELKPEELLYRGVHVCIVLLLSSASACKSAAKSDLWLLPVHSSCQVAFHSECTSCATQHSS